MPTHTHTYTHSNTPTYPSIHAALSITQPTTAEPQTGTTRICFHARIHTNTHTHTHLRICACNICEAAVLNIRQGKRANAHAHSHIQKPPHSDHHSDLLRVCDAVAPHAIPFPNRHHFAMCARLKRTERLASVWRRAYLKPISICAEIIIDQIRLHTVTYRTYGTHTRRHTVQTYASRAHTHTQTCTFWRLAFESIFGGEFMMQPPLSENWPTKLFADFAARLFVCVVCVFVWTHLGN